MANLGNNTVSQIDSTGHVTTFASSGLNGPAGLAFDAAGNLYVANTNAGTVSEFSATGASKGTFAFGLSDPIGLEFDAAGNLYVANNVAGTVSEFSSTGTSMGTFASGLSGPEFLAFAPTLSAVPEPGALTLAGIGLATLLGYGRLRCRRTAALTPRALPSLGAASARLCGTEDTHFVDRERRTRTGWINRAPDLLRLEIRLVELVRVGPDCACGACLSALRMKARNDESTKKSRTDQRHETSPARRTSATSQLQCYCDPSLTSSFVFSLFRVFVIVFMSSQQDSLHDERLPRRRPPAVNFAPCSAQVTESAAGRRPRCARGLRSSAQSRRA